LFMRQGVQAAWRISAVEVIRGENTDV